MFPLYIGADMAGGDQGIRGEVEDTLDGQGDHGVDDGPRTSVENGKVCMFKSCTGTRVREANSGGRQSQDEAERETFQVDPLFEQLLYTTHLPCLTIIWHTS